MQHFIPKTGGSAPSTTGGRMSLGNVTKGRIERPYKICLWGHEGCGKSTFASRAPNPIFLCSEDGTSQLDVARFPTPQHWDEVGQAIFALQQSDHDYRSLVIDTVDWLEPLCWAAVAQKQGKAHLEEIPYGRGHLFAVDAWRSLLAKLDQLVRTRKMHVILLGHSTIRKIDDPQTGAYDRHTLKIHEKSAAVLREWVDALLFARYEVVTVQKGNKVRGVSSGARVIHTQWTAAYDAKNRYDLPDTLPLDWEEFDQAAKAHAPAAAARLRAELLELIPRLEEPEKARKALEEWAGSDPSRLAQLLDKVRAKVTIAQTDEPAAPAGDEGGAS